MARPLSWLPRLHEIQRSVANSVRSHYDRPDVESLFELQPRAAQKLIDLLPTVLVGTSRLVERETLAKFLAGIQEAEDTSQYIDRVREDKAKVSRRKIRSLVRRDIEPASLTSLPDTMNLSRGRLEINFRTVEQLAEAMLGLARVLESEGEEFARAYEPQPPVPEPEAIDEVRGMFDELEDMEAKRSKRLTAKQLNRNVTL